MCWLILFLTHNMAVAIFRAVKAPVCLLQVLHVLLILFLTHNMAFAIFRAAKAPVCLLQVLHVLVDPVPDPQHGYQRLPSPWGPLSQPGGC